MIEKIITTAQDELFYLEKKSNAQLNDKTANAGSGNYTKFWRDLKPSFQGQPWCACFVSWCARIADIPDTIIPTFYDCDVGMKWFKTRSVFHTKPQRGDIVFFGIPGDSQHVGIVTDVTADRVHTIEGNTSGGSTMIANGGGVFAKSYALTYGKILGYGRPKYEKLEEDMTKAETIALLEELNPRSNAIGDVPEWGREAIQKLIDGKAFSDEKALNLSLDMIRFAVFLDRAGKL